MRLASLPAHCTGNGTLTEDVQFGYAAVYVGQANSKPSKDSARTRHGGRQTHSRATVSAEPNKVGGRHAGHGLYK